MKNRFMACVLAMAWWQTGLAEFKTALPGYHYQFPRDYFDHPDYQTEWWYYTGNITGRDGRHFGFELAFFRQGVSRDGLKTSVWDLRDIYMAHFALSDLDGGTFYHVERVNRAGPGIAGIDANRRRIWNGNWASEWNGEIQELRAFDEHFSISLVLRAQKPPVIHGENGVSQKADGPRILYASISPGSGWVGLAWRRVRRQQRVNALSPAPEGWHSGCLFRGNLR